MSSTAVLLAGLLPAVVFVMWPLFFSGDSDAIEALPEDDDESLQRKKVAALAAIKEAEFDQRTGKLSDDDFAALTARYKAQALEAIAALDQRSTSSSAPSGTIKFCPNCGTKALPGGKFCSGCGRPTRA